MQHDSVELLRQGTVELKEQEKRQLYHLVKWLCFLANSSYFIRMLWSKHPLFCPIIKQGSMQLALYESMLVDTLQKHTQCRRGQREGGLPITPKTPQPISPKNSSWVSIQRGWSTTSTVWLKKVLQKKPLSVLQ